MHARLSWFRIPGDLVHFLCLGLRSRASLAAENLFLRKQLAFYQERTVKPRRADNPTRLTLVLLSRWFNWRDALTVIGPRSIRRCGGQLGHVLLDGEQRHAQTEFQQQFVGSSPRPTRGYRVPSRFCSCCGRCSRPRPRRVPEAAAKSFQGVGK